MPREKKTTQFAVEVTGTNIDNTPEVNIPTTSIQFWLFKGTSSILYVCTTEPIDRKMFYSTYRGHTQVVGKKERPTGFTVTKSNTGPKAENYIRKLKREGGWQCSDQVEMEKFNRLVEAQEATLRIKWEGHTSGEITPAPTGF